jgi:hypothetical protein
MVSGHVSKLPVPVLIAGARPSKAGNPEAYMKTQSRRAMLGATVAATLAGAASVNLAAIVATKAEPSVFHDPVFAMLARIRDLDAHINASAYDDEYGAERCKIDCAEHTRLCDAILKAPINSPAAAAAMLLHVMEQELECHEYHEGVADFLRRLVVALKDMGAQA